MNFVLILKNPPLSFEEFLGLLLKYDWEINHAAEISEPNQADYFHVYGQTPEELTHLKDLLQTSEHSWEIHIEPINPQWQVAWQSYVQGFPLGKHYYVQPAWDKNRPENISNRTILSINCTLSFGLGNHPTTQMMVQLLEQSQTRGSFLDIGTGTGILTMIAAHLGFQPLIAIDYCPQAIASAKDNIPHQTQKNVHIEQIAIEHFHPEQTFDWICANLLSEILLQNHHHLTSLLSPKGYLALSGVSEQNAIEVEKKFQEDKTTSLKKIAHLQHQGWHAWLFQNN